MLEDKLRSTDWEATYEAIEEAVARESYLSWLREQERKTGTSRQGLQVREEGEMEEEGGREKGEWEGEGRVGGEKEKGNSVYATTWKSF